MKTYKLFKKSSKYTLGIYENCSDAVFLKKDGSRLRLENDTVVWKNNTGHYKRIKTYIEGRQNVKLFIKMLRRRTLDAIKCGLDPNSFYLIAGGDVFSERVSMLQKIGI